MQNQKSDATFFLLRDVYTTDIIIFLVIKSLMKLPKGFTFYPI